MKRILSLFFAALLCLSASACSSFLETDYVEAENYVDDMPVVEGSSIFIGNYHSLKNAIISLVESHQEEETLTFSGYDGDIAKDLSRVWSELKAESPLCAYAVDYISYDLSRIVAYYEAHISISFLRSAEQLERLLRIGSVINADETVVTALRAAETELVFSAVGRALSAEDINAIVQQVYYDAPLEWLQLPEASLSVYPNNGISRIYELRFSYGSEQETIEARLVQMREAAEELTAEISGEDADCAALAAALLSERCTWTQGAGGHALTAYGALVEGNASSEGFAMAYKALCDLLELECLIIRGRLDKTPHVWNMVRLGENYYHVDASQVWETGATAVLHSDSEMWARYWWDTELYPASGDEAIGAVTAGPDAPQTAPSGEDLSV